MFQAQTTLSFSDTAGNSGVSVEEAYVDTLSLPGYLNLRFGRFFSAVGYQNAFHSHAWDFHDAPLAYRAFLGGQYGDDGIQLNWLAPTDTVMVRLGGELLAGHAYPGAGQSHRTLGDSRSLFVKLGGDLGASHAWLAGLAALRVEPHSRTTGDGSRFSGGSNLYLGDLVWKWAPNGNIRQRNFKLQAEFLLRQEDGAVAVPDATAPGRLAYHGTQRGGYVQAVYQFRTGWRSGIRYDRLSSTNHLAPLSLGGFSSVQALRLASGLDDQGHAPDRWSLMLDWSPSEFSRLRLQYDRDRSRPRGNDDQWTLQYIMALGSHGAHEF